VPEWIDVSVWGSEYEQQFDPTTDQWRHRRGLLEYATVSRPDRMTIAGGGEWTTGPAPDVRTTRGDRG
jgi:hypothetical protein